MDWFFNRQESSLLLELQQNGLDGISVISVGYVAREHLPMMGVRTHSLIHFLEGHGVPLCS